MLSNKIEWGEKYKVFIFEFSPTAKVNNQNQQKIETHPLCYQSNMLVINIIEWFEWMVRVLKKQQKV